MLTIAKAANRYAMKEITKKGFQATINLYGKTFINAIQLGIMATIQKLMIKSSLKIMGMVVISSFISFVVRSVFDCLGW